MKLASIGKVIFGTQEERNQRKLDRYVKKIAEAGEELYKEMGKCVEIKEKQKVQQATSQVINLHSDRGSIAIGSLPNDFGESIDRIKQLEREFNSKDIFLNFLKGKKTEFQRRLSAGESMEDILPEAFAVVREASTRTLGMTHFDVQLKGGVVIHHGAVAEMVTGEGKTLTATLPAYLNALQGKVHIATANDYLARRDAEEMRPLYEALGLTVGFIQEDMDENNKKNIYSCDIVYGTASEFAFDYLRDNTAKNKKNQVQPDLSEVFVIVDEADHIMIDEARNPLIISGNPDEEEIRLYIAAEKVAREFREVEKDDKGNYIGSGDYIIEEDKWRIVLTEEGHKKLERSLDNSEDFWSNKSWWKYYIERAILAKELYKRDRNYLIRDGKIIIVNQGRGRAEQGKRWSTGIHKSIEVKEGVQPETDHKTVASITYQNFFKLYKKVSGMTGTAVSAREEFSKLYGLSVVPIPTNKPLNRIEIPDVIFRTEEEKFDYVVDEIIRIHKTGRPILVGTSSVAKSDYLSNLLEKKGIKHNVLNAKNEDIEAQIIAEAGKLGKVTVATNMAGRGTDIKLGEYNPDDIASWLESIEKLGIDNPEYIAAAIGRYKSEGVAGLGGLHIIGTERNDSRRVDDQLRGRAGRQGDPGSSQFFISLQDRLFRVYGHDNVNQIMDDIGFHEGALNSPNLSKLVEKIQKKLEGIGMDFRKNTMEYDEILNEQRRFVYGMRQRILDGEDVFMEFVDRQSAVMDTLREKLDKEEYIHYTDTYNGGETYWLRKTKDYYEFGTKDKVSLLRVRESQGPIFELESDDGIYRFKTRWINNGDLSVELINPEGRVYYLADSLNVNASTINRGEISKEVEKDRWHEERVRKELGYNEGGQRNVITENYLLLSCLDNAWIRYLNLVDMLRDGVGMRGYGQKDPKYEFKRDANTVFWEIMSDVGYQTIDLARRYISREGFEVPRLYRKSGELVR